jgi:hypothetical protein
VWAIVGPETLLSVAGRWEHEGTSTTEVAAASTMGDGPTVVAEDDAAIPLVKCKLSGTLVEHPHNYL